MIFSLNLVIKLSQYNFDIMQNVLSGYEVFET